MHKIKYTPPTDDKCKEIYSSLEDDMRREYIISLRQEYETKIGVNEAIDHLMRPSFGYAIFLENKLYQNKLDN